MSQRGQLYPFGICLLTFMAYGCGDNAESKLHEAIRIIGKVTPGTCEVGDAVGDASFVFHDNAVKVIYSVNVLGDEMSASESGDLEDLELLKNGPNGTYSIVGKWKRWEPAGGEGKFVLRSLDDCRVGYALIQISNYQYKWSYYANVELSKEQHNEFMEMMSYGELQSENTENTLRNGRVDSTHSKGNLDIESDGGGTDPSEPNGAVQFDMIPNKAEPIIMTLDSLLSFDSENDLKRVFGDNVKRSVGSDVEGTSEYGISLLYPNSKNEVKFIWKDDSVNFNGLLSVCVDASGTEWKTKEGITIGISTNALQTLNGNSFTFYGLGWDYGGFISDWHKGHLENRNISGRLGEISDAKDFEEGLMGERDIESSSDIAQKANLILVELVMKKD